MQAVEIDERLVFCRQMPAATRKQLWEAEHGPIPKGKRLGASCRVQYCDNFEHFCLIEDKSTRFRNWKPMIEQVRALNVGEFVEFPALALADMKLFRVSLNHNAKVWTAIRTAKNGASFRVYRTEWDLGRDINERRLETEAAIPVLYWPPRAQRPISPTRPHSQYLGLIAFESLHASKVRGRRCEEKGCAFPANGSAKCHRHEHFFEFKWSMEWRQLSMGDIYPTLDNPSPALSICKYEIQYPADHITTFSYKGDRDKGRKLSEDWWNENVLKYEADLQAARATRPTSKAWANVIQEPKVQYAPEPSATANKQHTGAFILWKGYGKKKIRKTQRMRPQGWHGNHPDQKPRDKFTRDTLDDLPQWAPQIRQEEPEMEECTGEYPEYTTLLDSADEYGIEVQE